MPTALPFEIAGTAIPLQAEEIQRRSDGERRPAILLLHGSGGHSEFWVQRLAPLMAEARMGLYAPAYFARTGTARADLATITDGYHVPLWLEAIAAALHHVAMRPGVDPQRIVLTGVSLGGFLAMALAAQWSAVRGGQDLRQTEDTRRIRAVINVSGGLVPPYGALATHLFPPTLILHGANDTVVDVRFARSAAQVLAQLKVPCRLEIFPGEGHWFSPAVLPRMLRALSEFLAQEQLVP